MTGYKWTPVCQVLVEKAETIGNPQTPKFTAERFLLAVIRAVAANDEPRLSGGEWEKLIEWHNQSLNNVGHAQARLAAAVEDPDEPAFLSDLYIKKRLQEAAAMMSGGVISAVNLCLAIACTPNRTVKELLTPAASSAEWKDEAVSVPDVVSGMDLETLLASELADESDDTVKPMDDDSAQPQAPAEDKKKAEDDVCKRFGGGHSDAETAEVKSTGQPPAQEEPVSVEGNKNKMVSLIEETKQMRNALKDKIFGQDNAINVFVTGYYQARIRAMTDKNRNRVLASFLFAGPPGVGKTFLAESAVAEMKLPFMRLDMSEYAGEEGVIEFCGLDRGYKDSHPGHVTTFVKENPRCVLLFDEVEKAHLDVIHLFLQMLDAGQVRDRHMNEEISFRDVIAIFTTNAGRPLYEETDILDFSTQSQKVVMKALRQDINPKTNTPYFPAALCSRFASGNVVMFNHMQAHHLRNIAKKEITRLAANLEDSAGIRFDIDEKVYTALLLSEGAAADARTVRGRAETFFNNETYELFRLIETKCAAGSLANVNTVKMTVALDGAEESVTGLFASGMQPRVLVLADQARVEELQQHLLSCTLCGVRTAEEAIEMIKTQVVDFALLDFRYGMTDGGNSLSIEDVASPARSFFRFACENKQSLPVYLLEQSADAMSEEERLSFLSQGARGVVLADDGASFAEQCTAIASVLRQQESMTRLAKQNKVVSFETAQSVSADGATAEITLFDLQLDMAVDASDAKDLVASTPDIQFDDVIGAEDAKAELQYFVEYLRNPNKYLGTGVKTPRGVLLYGPPGTGKTMLAKAMACESGCAYIAAQGNQFRQQFVGQGAETVRRLFRTARKYAPAILFIDEIDAIAKQRTGGGDGGSQEIEATLTAFLTEMDGFNTDPSKPVFVLAATNFDVKPGSEKSLDGALLRRFDNRIYVDLPNKEERVRFLNKKIVGNKAFAISPQEIESLSLRSAGMSLAELDSVMELALRSAIRQRSTVVNDAVLEEAFENFNHGEKKQWDASTLERVARHEAGHALMCWLGGEKPSYLTVVARGDHGGYMLRAEQEGKAIYTRDEMLARIRTSLGGRAAEIVYYGDRDGISSGASGDLQHATYWAQMILCSLGMDEEFGLAVVDPRAAVGELADEIRAAVNRILKEQMAETVRLIRENKETIDALVTELMYKNHLNEHEIARILSGGSDGNFKD
ncbi:MAG: AAA family ATPase [Clostridia bacterium]|nr:AAA family ATPase [Clostridia bacterium]